MTITLSEIQAAVDILFESTDATHTAFKSDVFRDELERAIDHVNLGGSIDYEVFNRVLTASYLGPVAKIAFERYFPRGINSAEKLKEGIQAFAKEALLHFGSFHQAFNRIKGDPSVLPRPEDLQFGGEDRAPFVLSHPIPVVQLAYLGYVSGELPTRMSNAHKTILALLEGQQAEITPERLRTLAKERGIDLDTQLSSLNAGLTARGEEQVTIDSFLSKQTDVERQIVAFVEDVRSARGQGLKNLEQYINISNDIDVYVATSMRDERDYKEMKAFVDAVFLGRKDVSRLNLRYFDPTQAYCANKYDKGLIECLMIRCAKVTIYCAQRQDTMGKDSELAITLGQGKPVIVYVPRGDTPDDKKIYDTRARTFNEVHPLSLQVNQRTGNTNGIILVRDECANVLYAIAKNQLKTRVERRVEEDPVSGQQSVCWVLRESVTGNDSVIRMATGWQHLRTAFWSAYRPDQQIPGRL